jgi:hypothetical protein
MQEPLEAYLDQFEDAKDAVDEFMEATVDLSRLNDEADSLLPQEHMLAVLRYLAGPPISTDDLKVIVDARSLSPAAIKGNPDLVRNLISTIFAGLDRRRFPWVAEAREPTTEERYAATVASAALIAAQRVATARRHSGKDAQEALVRAELLRSGLTAQDVPTRHVATMLQAPPPGHYCPHEVTLGDRKADLLVRLWDGRIMPIECKVSNSSTNSVKRLNNDAAAKAEVWQRDFGTTQVVPVAVLGGVYKTPNLVNAQNRGLTLYWSHNLAALSSWIAGTQPT